MDNKLRPLLVLRLEHRELSRLLGNLTSQVPEPPTIGHNIQRAVDEIASANGVSNKVSPRLVFGPVLRLL